MTQGPEPGVPAAVLRPHPSDGPNGRGKLRIFLGMSPGVGKTRAMLRAAQEERFAGRDVIIACLHDPTLAAKGTLGSALPKPADERERTAEPASPALDLQAVLARRPDIAIVDELAHANGADRAHPNRYQDVMDLLEAGIDVFTTLNLQQVTSRADAACEITGVPAGDLVPDSILDQSQLDLVDLAPRELLKRISRGDARLAPAQAAKWGLLDEARLAALRELTVRLFAEHVGKDLCNHSAGKAAPPGQRLLAILRPGQDSEAVVRVARRLSDTLNSPWVVLYVETSRALNAQAQPQVTRALAFARELGAEVLLTSDEDMLAATLRIATQRNVTHLVVGNPPAPPGAPFWRRDAFVRRLLRQDLPLALHLVPVQNLASAKSAASGPKSAPALLPQYLKAFGVIGLVTLAGFLITPLVGPHTTALFFLLTVVLLALFVDRGPTLAAAAASALVWDYFFLPPLYAFPITHFEDAMLFAMYFVVALVLGHFTSRLRSQQEAEREREARATALYLLTRDLNEAVDLDQMAQRIVRQLEASFAAPVALLLPGNAPPFAPHPASTFHVPENESGVSAWVVQNRQRAGKLTPNLPNATGHYLPLTTTSGVVGVLALRFSETAFLNWHQEHLLDAFSHQIAMALDRHRLNGLSETARLLAESERLSQTLLDSMSHEVRTPIAAIKSATGTLAELPDSDTITRRHMLAEIQEATDRLNRSVGNVLEASRLESGTVKPRLTECDVRDLIQVTLADTEKELATHKVTVTVEPDLPLITMDFVLTQQALTNLLSNAAAHTPPGTLIELAARIDDDDLLLSVADRGPGIPPEFLPRIFDKFYRLPNSRTGGIGLGLSLVKGFVEAQGGRVTAKNRIGGGSLFTLCLPRTARDAATSEPEL